MARYEVDFEDYEERTGYNGDEPKPGLYPAVLVEMKDHKAESSGLDSIKWVFRISEGTYKGWQGYVYSNLTTTKWRTQEVVLAITGGDKSGFVLDTDREDKIVKKAKAVKIRLKHEEYQGEKKAKIRTVIPARDAEDTPAAKPSSTSNDPWDDDDDD